MTRAAVFLDRDGTLNIDSGYIDSQELFQFIDGAVEACHQLQQMGYQLVLVTNQSGIGRGKFSKEQFLRLTEWMQQWLAAHQVQFSAVYYCPHPPPTSHTNAEGSDLPQCLCRKPQPGMLLTAKKQLKLDMARSYMIGDKLTDLQAATAAGVGTKVLVRSGQLLTPQAIAQADHVLDSVAALPAIIAAKLSAQPPCC